MHRAVFERLASPLGVVVRESESVRFSVYSDDDIRRLSVARVHSAEQRDALNRPLPGGLYDPGMGPTDHYSSCPSCGLDYTHCPGHLGGIDSRFPFYITTGTPNSCATMAMACGVGLYGLHAVDPLASVPSLVAALWADQSLGDLPDHLVQHTSLNAWVSVAHLAKTFHEENIMWVNLCTL